MGVPVGPATGRGSVGRASVVGAARPKAVPGASGPGRKKKRISKRRRRVYAALIMVCLMMLGAITVAGSWFFESVPAPEDLAFGESTTFTYSGSDTPIAGYGEYTRKLVDDYGDLPDSVVWSLLALEDKDFFEHEGVDYKGTMRALINNIKGGDTQGASTISQQYAGMVSDIRGDISYGRKAKEAVMAMKLEQEYSKKDILLHYLNLNFYGRGTYGIAAASEVWFGTKVEELSWAQGMMLVMQVKAGDGSFDPRVAGEESTAPSARWTHGMETLLTMTEDISEEDRAIIQEQLDAGMPETLETLKNPGSWGHDTTTGFITNPTDGYVWAELESRWGLDKKQFYGHDAGTGGYTVVLTIDPVIQAAASATASRGHLKVMEDEDGNFLNADGEKVENRADAEVYKNDKGYFEFENTNDEAALFNYNTAMTTGLVAIEPKTGAVLGYYGGEDGTGIDKSGPESPHPASSTFKMVTAATALTQGASIDSWWNADSPREFESLGDVNDGKLRNGQQSDPEVDMTLADAVINSKNTPMYAIADKYGASTVLSQAVDMGLTTLSKSDSYTYLNGEEANGANVTYSFVNKPGEGENTYSRHGVMLDENGDYVTDSNGAIDYWAAIDSFENADGEPINNDGVVDRLVTESPRYPADNQIGFGQYPVSVRDMAAIYATIANDGVYVETHYVAKLLDRNGNEVPPERELYQEKTMDVGMARDLQYIGGFIGEGPADQRPFFGKTGTWEADGYEAECRNDPDTTDVAEQCEKYPEAYSAHAWYTGAIPQLSVATWVGNATSESDPIYNDQGSPEGVAGGNTSAPVWQKFMDDVIGQKEYERTEWGQPTHVGNPILDDILNEDGTIDADSEYCIANPTDTKCKRETPPASEDCPPIWEAMNLCTPEDDGRGNGRGDDD
ncbi:transglycosylase domain-containing protein [Glycomyces paridis]|uniref:Penicillin-binding protein n=1 Tax=Glycomyces paridis TaxID=2126555 RepID=A0A4V4HPV5_9ACTN|nr:transglycosylase domain-containing protein [Glycomyces paridis]THV31316.1 penicillin-binding protein [Glycomyces paridis]